MYSLRSFLFFLCFASSTVVKPQRSLPGGFRLEENLVLKEVETETIPRTNLRLDSIKADLNSKPKPLLSAEAGFRETRIISRRFLSIQEENTDSSPLPDENLIRAVLVPLNNSLILQNMTMTEKKDETSFEIYHGILLGAAMLILLILLSSWWFYHWFSKRQLQEDNKEEKKEEIEEDNKEETKEERRAVNVEQTRHERRSSGEMVEKMMVVYSSIPLPSPQGMPRKQTTPVPPLDLRSYSHDFRRSLRSIEQEMLSSLPDLNKTNFHSCSSYDMA